MNTTNITSVASLKANDNTTFLQPTNALEYREVKYNVEMLDTNEASHATLFQVSPPTRDLFPIDTFQSLIERPVYIMDISLARDSWAINPLAALMEADYLGQLFNRFEMVRFDLEVTLLLSTNKMNFGMLLVSWLPYPMFTFRAYMRAPQMMFQLPHVELDLSENRRYEVTIPYVGQQDYIPIDSMEFDQYGVLMMQAYAHNLMEAERAPQLGMMARFKNLKFAVPRRTVAPRLFSQTGKFSVPLTDYNPTIPNSTTNVSSVVFKLDAVKNLSSVGTHEYWAQSGVSVSEEAYQDSIAFARTFRVVRNRINECCEHCALVREPLRYVRMRAQSGLAISAMTSKLADQVQSAITSVKQVGVHLGAIADVATGVLLGTSDHTALSGADDGMTAPASDLRARANEFHLLQMYSLYTGFPDIYIPVAPTVAAAAYMGSPNKVVLSHPLLWYTRMFRRWSGSLRFRFKITGTVFTARRIKVTWSPTMQDPADSVFLPKHIVDGYQSVVYDVTVPWMSVKKMLAVGAFNGWLSITSGMPLVASSPNKTGTPMNGLIVYIAPGEDFRVDGPTTAALTLHVPKWATTSVRSRAAVATPPNNVGFPPFDDSDLDVVLDYFYYAPTFTWYRVVMANYERPNFILPQGRQITEISSYNTVTTQSATVAVVNNTIQTVAGAKFAVFLPAASDPQYALLQYDGSNATHGKSLITGADLPATRKVWDGVAIAGAPLGNPTLDYRKYDPAGELIQSVLLLGSSQLETGTIRADDLTKLIFNKRLPVVFTPLLTGVYVTYRPTEGPPVAGTISTDYTSSEYGIITATHTYDGTAWQLFVPIPTPADDLPILPASTATDIWLYNVLHNGAIAAMHNSEILLIFDLQGSKYELRASPEFRAVFPSPIPWTSLISYTGLTVAFQTADIIITSSKQGIVVEYPHKHDNSMVVSEITVAGVKYWMWNNEGLLNVPTDVMQAHLPTPLSIVDKPDGSIWGSVLINGNIIAPDVQVGSKAGVLYDITSAGWVLRAQPNNVVPPSPPPTLFRAQSGTIAETPVDINLAEKTEEVGQATPTDLGELVSSSVDKFKEVLTYASFLATIPIGVTYIQPLGPISPGPFPQTYMNWIRATYLFSHGTTRLKLLPKSTARDASAYATASVLPYTGPIESAGYVNTNPPVDLRQLAQLASYVSGFLSTGSVGQNISATPLDVIIPYYSDSPALFNVLDDILTDNSYTTLMINSNVAADVYLAAGSDLKFKFPMPCPALVPDVWAELSTSTLTQVVFGDSTSVGWWDWFLGLVTSPVATLTTTFTRAYQYVAIATGFYNNYTLPGTFASVEGFFV